MQRKTTLSLVSRLRISCAKCGIAPASTTAWASSGVCLQMSLRVEAAMRLRAISGSSRHNTRRGTAPAFTTVCDKAAGEQKEENISRKRKQLKYFK